MSARRSCVDRRNDRPASHLTAHDDVAGRPRPRHAASAPLRQAAGRFGRELWTAPARRPRHRTTRSSRVRPDQRPARPPSRGARGGGAAAPRRPRHHRHRRAPGWRRSYGPLVVAVAAAATVLLPVATSSGEALEERVGNPGEHAELGDQLIWFALPMLVLRSRWCPRPPGVAPGAPEPTARGRLGRRHRPGRGRAWPWSRRWPPPCRSTGSATRGARAAWGDRVSVAARIADRVVAGRASARTTRRSGASSCEALRLAGHEVVDRPRRRRGGPAVRRATTTSTCWSSTSGCPTPTAATCARRCARPGSTRPCSSSPRSARSHDRLSGFGAGGDDYVPKPFDGQGAHRPGRGAGPPRPAGARGRPAGPVLDPARHAAAAPRRGEVLLTPTEFRMLAAITSRPGEVVRRRAVVAAAWPDGAAVSENTVDSSVRRVRGKLERLGSPMTLRHRARRRVPAAMRRGWRRPRPFRTPARAPRRPALTALAHARCSRSACSCSCTDIIEGNLDRVLAGPRRRRGRRRGRRLRDAARRCRTASWSPGVVVFDAAGEPVAGRRPAPRPTRWRPSPGSTSRQHVDVGEATGSSPCPSRPAPARAAWWWSASRWSPTSRPSATSLLASAGWSASWWCSRSRRSPRWVTSRALAPVAVMAATAQDWSEHDLAGRFDARPADQRDQPPWAPPWTACWTGWRRRSWPSSG